MQIEFGYGNTKQIVDIPDRNLLAVLTANQVLHDKTGTESVEYALDHPIDSLPLEEIVRKGQKITILTSDITRPFPGWIVLPSILRRLTAAGIPDEDITIVFAIGSHRNHTEKEKEHLVGSEIFHRYRCIDSDPDDCVRVGISSNGTPFDITRTVTEADIRIALGNIEFHYFAGYSGGVKALMPGASSPSAIQSNHSLMVSDRAYAGNVTDNPVRTDLEEVLNYCPVHFIVNVILDEQKNIVHTVAGNVIRAHRAGCTYLDRMYNKSISQKADIVLVSQGGAPKDATLYQTQKALDNAKHAVKKNGTVIVIGACNEGFGSKRFEEWLLSAPSSHSLIDRIQEHFELGGHKAAAIAMILENARVDLVSEMDADIVRRIFLHPQPDAQTAFCEAMKRYGENASVIAMPYGGSTLPHLQSSAPEQK